MKLIRYKLIQYSPVLLFLLFSCASASIQSVRATGAFEGKIDRLFVIMKADRYSQRFFEKMEPEFVNQFTNAGITVEAYLDKPLTIVSENEINDRIADLGANFIMILHQTVISGVTNEFDVKIFYKPGDDKPIWRSSVRVKNDGYTSMSGMASTAVKTVVDRLKDDKLL